MTTTAITVPGCVFAWEDFSHAKPDAENAANLRIEFRQKGWAMVPDFSLDDFEDAVRQSLHPEWKVPDVRQ